MNVINIENTEDILAEIQSAFYDIPFENSKFQTECFVLAAQTTPERVYRAIGLRMHSKLSALNEAKFTRLKDEVDLEEIEYKLNHGELSKFDRKREEIKKQEILSKIPWTNKLINDALVELTVLYKHFKALPKYTREDFESGEKLHFEQKLSRQLAGIEGTKESLVNMNEDLKALEYFQEMVPALTTKEDIHNLVAKLPNLIKLEK